MSQRRIETDQIFPAPPELDGIHEGLEFGPRGVRTDHARGHSARTPPRRAISTRSHTDEDYARDTGAPTVFAMGMLPAGYLATAVSKWFGGPQHLTRLKFRFTTACWPGDEVVCTAR